MDIFTGIADAFGSALGFVDDLWVTDEETQVYEIQGDAIAVNQTAADTAYLYAQDDAVWDISDTTEVITYAGIAAGLIILIAIAVVIIKK